MKYTAGQIVLIYEGHKTMIEGGVGRIIDRDPNDKSYLVGEDLETAVWVAENDCEVLSFERPKKTLLQKVFSKGES